MFKPDIATNILQHSQLDYQHKVFLLWCWDRSLDKIRYDLTSCRQNCGVRNRTVQWYANKMGIHRQRMSIVLIQLKELGIVKIEYEGTRNECTYVDFTMFC